MKLCVGFQKRGTRPSAGFLTPLEGPDNFVLPEDTQGHLHPHYYQPEHRASGKAWGQADGSGASNWKLQGPGHLEGCIDPAIKIGSCRGSAHST